MRVRRVPRQGEAGFSMVEMLMTAFVLSIGLLGLSMLQAMSLRAARGSRSLSTAVKLAGGVMDAVEMEGRLSWLNVSQSLQTAPSNAQLPTLIYIPVANQNQTYNLLGEPVNAGSTDPAQANPFFQVNISQVPDTVGASGSLSDFTVVVTFADTVNGTQAPAKRMVTLTRRILHG